VPSAVTPMMTPASSRLDGRDFLICFAYGRNVDLAALLQAAALPAAGCREWRAALHAVDLCAPVQGRVSQTTRCAHRRRMRRLAQVIRGGAKQAARSAERENTREARLTEAARAHTSSCPGGCRKQRAAHCASSSHASSRTGNPGGSEAGCAVSGARKHARSAAHRSSARAHFLLPRVGDDI